MTVIDVHTHMLDKEWLRLLRDHDLADEYRRGRPNPGFRNRRGAN